MNIQGAIWFRVYPESIHSFYFDVLIFKTRKRMHEWLRSAYCNPDEDCRAMVQSITKYNRAQNLTKTLGTINLCMGDLGAEVISHECTHAALRWAEKKKIDIFDQKLAPGKNELHRDSGEELFAYAIGRMCAQISYQLWKQDLVKAGVQEETKK